MAEKRSASDPLFATTWVHVHEEDTAEGQVYRPEDGGIPLSRRPRERIRFRADGTASVSMPGPDDRPMEKPATWGEARDSAQFLLVRQSVGRLIIRAT